MVLCLDEIQVRFGWNKCRWGDCVVWVSWRVLWLEQYRIGALREAGEE